MEQPESGSIARRHLTAKCTQTGNTADIQYPISTSNVHKDYCTVAHVEESPQISGSKEQVCFNNEKTSGAGL
jgi:hypothetical protein